MRLLSIDNVTPGVILGKTIYDGQGRILLTKGTELLPQYIKRLSELGVWSVYVEDELAASIVIDDVVSEQLRVQVKQATKEVLQKVQAGRSIESKAVRESVSDLMDEILRNDEVIIHVTDVRSLQDHTFGHSVNVCILSMLTGMAMGYDQLKIKDLGTGALLHDVGKAMIPEHIINLPRNLSVDEYRTVQKHPDHGFEVLRKAENLSAVIAHVAWQHHERFNGHGYPRKLAGKNIHEFARIAAIADVYDALSTDRPYRQRMLPHQVVEVIRDSQDTDFDGEIVKAFLQNIAPYPKGTIVLLNNGFRGIVADVRKGFPTRPKIHLLYAANGQKLENKPVIDLMQELTVFVTEVIRD